MGEAKAKRLFILDGNYYIFRAYYGNQYLATSEGFPTGAIFAFTRMMQRLIATERPHWMAVAFDVSRGGFRSEMYEEYKANRQAPPDELVLQAPRIREVVKAHNIPVLAHADFEADDLIATLTRKARAAGMEVVIVSADKDLMQLLDEGTTMLDTMRSKVFTVKDVVERFQVGPEQVVDVLGLAGDTSDNIPGVPGIGEKTAGKLIAEHGSLEALLANTDKVSGKKTRENLEAFAEQARMSRELVRLRTDCDVDLDPDALTVGEPDWDALEELYRGFEFMTMLTELQEQRNRPAPPKPVPRGEKRYRTVLTASELDAVIAAILEAGRVAVEVQLTSPEPHTADLIGVALAWTPHAAVYIPMQHRYIGAPEQVSLEVALEKLRPILEGSAVQKIGHLIQREWIVLRRYGVEYAHVGCDVMLASYLVDPTRKSEALEPLAEQLLGMKLAPWADVVGRGRKQTTFDMLDVDVAMAWAAERVDAALLLYGQLWPQLQGEAALLKLHDTLEIPLSDVLARMAMHGVLVDIPLLKQLSGQYDRELGDLSKKIFALAGGEFNINSPAQLGKILFEDLALPVLKRTKSGPSTDSSVLEQLSEEHELPDLILEYRSFAKLKSTYVDALPLLLGHDGRIHCDFNQAIAATGRLSSSNPNLQNIPVRTERGREIRKAFIAPEGWSLLTADYSQIELRILAHMAGDPTLIDAFRRGEDIHRRTASEIFEVPPDQINSTQRSVGKTINFGVIYGMGATRLARDLGITRKDADRYISAYFDRYSAIRRYFDGLVEQARRHGFVTTLFGRRRPIPEVSSSKPNLRSFGERTAVNTPIQGTAADIIKLAMLEVQQRIDQEGWPATMILQVHDELIFEVRTDAIEAFSPVVAKAMREVIELRAPLAVDLGVGRTWLDCK